MTRLAAMCLTTCLATALPGHAEELQNPVTVQLTATQVDTLLRGNTIVGTWSGNRYTQFFAENGATTYAPEGGRPEQGKWRVNTASHQYESWWERSNWAGYTVMMTNSGYAWVNRDTLEPFAVYEGRQGEW